MFLSCVFTYFHNGHLVLESYLIHQITLHSESWALISMMSIVFILIKAWLSYQNTNIFSYSIGKTNGSSPSKASFVFGFRRNLSSSLSWWSDLHQKWIATDYSVGNTIQYEEKNLWHCCWVGQELNRYFPISWYGKMSVYILIADVFSSLFCSLYVNVDALCTNFMV